MKEPLGVRGVVLLALCASMGCTAERTQGSFVVTPAGDHGGDSRPVDIRPPVNLATSAEQAIVRLVADVSPTLSMTCTGTLIAEDLVLTAHHCVSRRDASGRAVHEDVQPKDVNVELGTMALPWGEVGVRAIVSPDCGYTSGEGDLAVLVLSRKLVGVATISPRREPPKLNEVTRAFGFGRCAESRWRPVELSPRKGGPIEFENRDLIYGSAQICPGDSGGPVFVTRSTSKSSDRRASVDEASDEDLELVGVVSASVMDPSASGNGFSIFTRIDAWPQLLSAAQEIANGATSSELPPYRSCEAPLSTQAAQAKKR